MAFFADVVFDTPAEEFIRQEDMVASFKAKPINLIALSIKF